MMEELREGFAFHAGVDPSEISDEQLEEILAKLKALRG